MLWTTPSNHRFVTNCGLRVASDARRCVAFASLFEFSKSSADRRAGAMNIDGRVLRKNFCKLSRKTNAELRLCRAHRVFAAVQQCRSTRERHSPAFAKASARHPSYARPAEPKLKGRKCRPAFAKASAGNLRDQGWLANRSAGGAKVGAG